MCLKRKIISRIACCRRRQDKRKNSFSFFYPARAADPAAEGDPAGLLRLFLVPIFIISTLSGCQSESRWSVDRLEEVDKEYAAAKLLYQAPDPIHGIDLEMVHAEKDLKIYLHVHSHPVPCSQESPKETHAHLIIDGAETPFFALRYEGGQRLLMPTPIAEALIAALKSQQKVAIKLPGYAVTIEPAGFSPAFKKLLHTPLISNPFKLPF